MLSSGEFYGVPVPERQTVIEGLFGSFVLNVAVAVRVPTALGVKVTLKLAEAPATIVRLAGVMV